MLDPRILAQLGRYGDTMVAHISPREAMALRMMGGSGSINPMTGLPEFWDDGGNDPGGMGGDTGSTGFGGDATGMGGDPSVEGYGNIDPDAAQTDTMALNDDLGSILSDMENQASRNETIGRGFMADPSGYLGAVGMNYGKAVENAFWEAKEDPMGAISKSNIPAVLAAYLFGVPGAAAVAAAQGKGKQAGALGGMTIGGTIGGPFGMAIGGLAGYGLGSLFEGGVTSPDMSDVESQSQGKEGSDYNSMAQNLIGGPTGVSQAQAVSQPQASFDRDAFGQFGQGMIQKQSRSEKEGTKSGAAARGMGQDSGQMMGQLAIQNQRTQQQMAQWNKIMSDKNMGYNDLAQSLMNILA